MPARATKIAEISSSTDCQRWITIVVLFLGVCINIQLCNEWRVFNNTTGRRDLLTAAECLFDKGHFYRGNAGAAQYVSIGFQAPYQRFRIVVRLCKAVMG